MCVFSTHVPSAYRHRRLLLKVVRKVGFFQSENVWAKELKAPAQVRRYS